MNAISAVYSTAVRVYEDYIKVKYADLWCLSCHLIYIVIFQFYFQVMEKVIIYSNDAVEATNQLNA